MRKMTIDELLENYAAGKRDFRGIKFNTRGKIRSLENVNLSGADLKYSNLESITFFTKIDLSKSDLKGLIFERSNFEGANFSGANLSYTDLWRSDFSDANFSDANLSGANLHETVMACVNFSGANFSGAYLKEARFSHSNLAGCNFTYAKGIDSDVDIVKTFKSCSFQNTIMPDGSIRNS